VLLTLATLGGANVASAQTMEGLGYLPGALDLFSNAVAASADGSTVVGYGIDSQGDAEAFRWTAQGGMKGLGLLPDCFASYAAGVSADGSTVVGYCYDSQYHLEAFVWTAATGMVGLGTLFDLFPGSYATGVSADGSTVVGSSFNEHNHGEAFIWTAAAGMVRLGALPGAWIPNSFGLGISADGSTVVGQSANSLGNSEAFVWTAATGMVGLGTVGDPLYSQSSAAGVSCEGTVVGTTGGYNDQFGFFQEAFIWTAATGMIGLGTMGDLLNSYSYATGVSADGSTVVGAGGLNFGRVDEAFIWTAATGMVALGALPGAAYTKSIAYGVSADGLTVVGGSIPSDGDFEAFILNLASGDPVEILIVGLIPQVASVNLKQGIENSLDAKLDAAFDALDGASAQNDVAAINGLKAFINAVKAQSGKAIPTADANSLIAAAQEIIGLLQ
jgi:probable HAF family extracellular repeat protein